MMKLSNRLEMVVSMVQPGKRVADIGTDHGHVPIELIKRGFAEYAYAMDVRKGPLSKAQENVAASGLNHKIETRLSDGLQKIGAGEADSVIIAGMGGELVIHILEDGHHMWNTVEQWILSPHSEQHKVRQWLWIHGFPIVREEMVYEEGKYYTIMDVRKYGTLSSYEKDTNDMDEKAFRYSPYLRISKNPIFLDYLKDEESKLESLKATLGNQASISDRAKESLREVEEKLMMNREVQHEMQ